MASQYPLKLNKSMFQDAIASLPKVELHLHLDTSLSIDFVRQFFPAITQSQFEQQYIASDCRELADFLAKVHRQLDLLQTEQALRFAVDDLFQQLKRDNVKYVELRFAPLLHLTQQLTAEQVVEIVLDAMQTAQRTWHIQAGLILCTLRHFSPQQSLQTAQLVTRYASQGVVALDLAADEARYPLDAHLAAFRHVTEAGGNVIAHAGEAKGADSVIESIQQLNVSRIGHGVRAIESLEAIELIKERNVLLEVCPSCNIVCNVFDTIEQHPVDALLNHGVKLSINTDARTTSFSTLNKEYQQMVEVFDWPVEQLQRCNLNAINASFASDDVKSAVTEMILG